MQHSNHFCNLGGAEDRRRRECESNCTARCENNIYVFYGFDGVNGLEGFPEMSSNPTIKSCDDDDESLAEEFGRRRRRCEANCRARCRNNIYIFCPWGNGAMPAMPFDPSLESCDDDGESLPEEFDRRGWRCVSRCNARCGNNIYICPPWCNSND